MALCRYNRRKPCRCCCRRCCSAPLLLLKRGAMPFSTPRGAKHTRQRGGGCSRRQSWQTTQASIHQRIPNPRINNEWYPAIISVESTRGSGLYLLLSISVTHTDGCLLSFPPNVPLVVTLLLLIGATGGPAATHTVTVTGTIYRT